VAMDDLLHGVEKPEGTESLAVMQAATFRHANCDWCGGNDIAYCRACGIEYDWRKQPQPACRQFK
jgi:hypothetical protein